MIATSRVAGLFLLVLNSATFGQPTSPDIPKPNPLLPDGAWAGALKEHPRLLGPKAHLQQLAQAQPDSYKAIKADRELLLSAGIVHAVEGAPRDQIDKWVAVALKNVDRGVTNVHQDSWIYLTDTVLVYDLFHDQLTAAQRSKIIDWLNAHLAKYQTDEGAFHNSTHSKILCYLRIAYGTWNDNPRAQEFRAYALTKLYEGKVVPTLTDFGQGGGATECGWYARGSLWHLVQGLELARRFEHYDGFAKAPRFFYHRLAYELYQPYPGLWTYGAEHYPVEGDGSNLYGGHVEYPRHLRTVLAQYFRSSELARVVASKRRRGSNLAAVVVDFLYAEPADQQEKPLPLDTLPLAHHSRGIGKVYARGDWTDDATWFRFECGDYFTAHQHYEVGNFEIFRYAELATESGEYHDWGSSHAMNYLIRTVAHNCILVYQEGETWRRGRDGGNVPYANDGGQTMKWEWPADTVAAWNAQRASFHRGDILAYDNQPGWMYVAGDCTPAYAPTKLSSWVRQIVFLRPGTFVIFDRVVCTKPEYQKTWLLHCMNEPALSGGGGGGGDAGATATITNGKGKLVSQTLLPERATIRKVQGYTYRGQTFDPPTGPLSAVAPKWRIEVLPAAPATEDLFLHVLTTVDSPPAKLTRQGAGVTVSIGANQVTFTGKTGGTLTAGGKTAPLETKVKAGKYE